MASSASPVRLCVRDMRKLRGDREREVEIVIPAFEIAAGGCVAVIGANGSGKSTLLDLIGLILSPDSVGEFVLNADAPVDLRRLRKSAARRIRRRHMAYVLQSGGLLAFLTVRENMRLAASLRRRPPGSLSAVMNALRLQALMHRRPGTLSGGQRQRAAIACALVREADIVLADEPTSALDAASAGRLVQTFARLTSESGSSLVLVTHDAALAARCADRVYRFSVQDCAARHARSTLAEVPAPVVTGSASC